MKSWQKLFLILSLLVIVVIGGAYAALVFWFPKEKVTELITVEASKALHREVGLQDLSVSLWPLGIELKNLSVAGIQDSTFENRPLVTLESVLLRIDLGALFTGSMNVNEVSLSGLTAYLEIDPAGKNSLHDLIKEADTAVVEEKKPLELPELPVDIRLDKFTLGKWSVELNDRQNKRQIRLGELNQEMNLYANKDLSEITTKGLLTLAEISVSDQASGLRKGNISVSVAHDIKANLRSGEVSINGIDINALGMPFTLKGNVKNVLDSLLNFDLSFESAEISMENVLKEVPHEINPEIAKLAAEGAFKLAVYAKGTPAKPEVNGSLDLQKLGFSHTASPAKIESLNGKILFSPDSVQIPSLSLLVGKNPINVEVALNHLMSNPYLQKLMVNGSVELDNILPLADAMGLLPDSLEAHGEITFDLKGSGPMDPANPTALNISGGSNMKLTQIKVFGVAPRIDVQGQSTFNKNQLTSAVKAQLGKSDFGTKIVVRDFLAMVLPKQYKGIKTRVDLEVRSQNLNLDELMPPANAEEPEAASELPEEFPVLPPVDVYVDVQLGKTLFKHLTLSDFTLKSKVVDSKVSSQMSAKLYEGQIEQSLSSDFSDPRNAQIQFDLSTTKVQFNDLFVNGRKNLVGESTLYRTLPKLDNTIFGKSDLVMTFATHGTPRTVSQNLSGTLQSSVYQGKIAETSLIKGYNSAISAFSSSLQMKDLSFDQFDAEIDVADGKFIVKHVDLKETPVGFLDLKGTIAFEGGLDLQLENHLPQGASKKILGTQSSATSALADATGLGALKNVSALPTTDKGEVKVYYFITGTMADPKYGLDAKRMESEGSAGAKDALAAEKARLEAEAKAKLDAEKKKVEDRIAAEKAKAKAKLDAEKKKATEKAKAAAQKQTDKAKGKAKDEAKKALKKFGF